MGAPAQQGFAATMGQPAVQQAADTVRVRIDPNTTIVLNKPIWYSNQLKAGLTCDCLRDLMSFAQCISTVPIGGRMLRNLIDVSITSMAQRITTILPDVKGDTPGYGVARAPLMQLLVHRWAAMQYDSKGGSFADAAQRDLLECWVAAFSSHHLFKARASVWNAFLSDLERSSEQMVLHCWHVCDEMYVLPPEFSAVSNSKKADKRAWLFGEDAYTFLGALEDAGTIEGLDDDVILGYWRSRVYERSIDPEVHNRSMCEALVDRHVNVERHTRTVSELKRFLEFDNAKGRAPLQRTRMVSLPTARGREERPKVYVVGGDGEDLAERFHDFLIQGEAGDREEDESYYGAGTGDGERKARLVPGPADWDAWLKAGFITTAAHALPFMNPKRADGLWGLDCPGCVRRGFKREYNYQEYRAAFGSPPWGQHCTVPVSSMKDVTIVHAKEECPSYWWNLTKGPQMGKFDASLCRPVERAPFQARLGEAQRNHRIAV